MFSPPEGEGTDGMKGHGHTQGDDAFPPPFSLSNKSIIAATFVDYLAEDSARQKLLLLKPQRADVVSTYAGSAKALMS